MIRRKLILLLLIINLLSSMNANDKFENESEAFDNFLNILEETTQIATKNKINADYAPGIITILKSEDLKRMGIKDFYEALKLIPSVDIKISSIGTKNIITRGIGGVTGSGKTKIMINGVGQNSNASGIVHFNLPIEIIDRIEVIRGPASALYGEYAFNGTINIITKKDTNSIFDIKSSNGNIVGGIFNYNQDDLSIDTVVSYTKDKGIEPFAKGTLTTNNNIETLREEQNFISNIKYKNFIVNIALDKAKKGEFYGLVSSLPKNNNKENFIYDYKTIELSNKFTVNHDFSFTPKIGYFKYKYYMDSTSPPMVSTSKYSKKYIIIDSTYNYDINDFLLGVEYSTMKETTNSSNKRDLSAIYLHDNIKITDRFSINTGIRYESYTDNKNSNIDNYTSSRIATIYKANNNHIFKFQYAQAYRTPSFLEGVSIKSETIDTYEVQHILKNDENQIRSTLFYSNINNLIVNIGGSTFKNETNKIISKGAELEIIHNFNNDFLLNSNISYSDVYYKQSKQDLINYSHILSNISLSYLPYSRFSSTINIRYIGSQDRDITDTKDELKAQSTVDISFKYLPYKIKNNMEVIFGIKNITNIDIKSPSIANTIENDLVYAQREYFVGITYKY